MYRYIIDESKQKEKLIWIIRKAKNHIKSQKELAYKNNNSFLGYLMYSIILLFFPLFQISLCQTESYIYMTFSAKSASNSQIIGVTTGVTSITDNGITKEINVKIAAVKGDNEVIVTYQSPMKNCTHLLKNSVATYIDLSNFDSSQCSLFVGMFFQCSSLTSIKLGGKFITSNAVDMTAMFNTCGSTKSNTHIDLSNFDTSKVTSMKEMFKSAAFKFLDLSSFDTSNVNTMESMFESEYKLLSVDLSSFDTSKVTSMKSMFSSCSQLVSLDISSFQSLDSLKETNQMFYQSRGFLKFCEDTPALKKLSNAISQGSFSIDCEDPCFTNSVNVFINNKCVENCENEKPYLYEYDHECVKKCPNNTEENPPESKMCKDILFSNRGFLNYEKTECINEVPEGYYFEDETNKSINICPDKCKTCELESVESDLCNKCNTDNNYFEAEGYSNSVKYVNCFNEVPEGYFFSEDKYLKCYQSCKSCTELGDSQEHKCTQCKSNMIQELGSNCYDICPDNQTYYFDEGNEYYCDNNPPEGYKFIPEKNKYTKDCKNDPPYIYQFEDICMVACPDKYHAPNDDKVCIVALICEKYYNYNYTGCLDTIPSGYFCNSTEKKTIDKCQDKCKECTIESFNNDLCTECNENEGYFKLDDNSINIGEQIECINNETDGYYSTQDNLMKKCYKTCKKCDSEGNAREHLCKECYDGYTLNDTNCYNICEYHYYFDSNMEYFCTTNEDCPAEKSKLILDTNECVEECKDEYKYELENNCYKACPENSYYNYEQTNCIRSIPEGYYLNDTQTIDKCNSKCQECDINSISNNICISCNNSLGYYKKEGDIINSQYYECYSGEIERYYLDLDDKEYKKCYKTCKNCNGFGDAKNNNCTECFSDSTLNKTNCYEICQYYHYFDDVGEYHCTQDKECPNIRSKLIINRNECVEKCKDEYKLEIDNNCYEKCPNELYFNYEQDGCIDSIPVGYYLNDSIKRTIDICDQKCENECLLDESINKVLCKSCNSKNKYYRTEEKGKNGFYDCFTGKVEKYFFEDNIYRKCYKTCKYCEGYGDNWEHNCTECYPGYTLNDTYFCYEICDYFYYFDSNLIYHCTETDECPSDFQYKILDLKTCEKTCPFGDYKKLVVETNACVKECKDEYKFEIDNKCYKECPKATYYNYAQDGCIDAIPIGYYLNDSLARTIDKCDIKCESECILDNSTNKVLCKFCNTGKKYYRKADEAGRNGYFDCYTGAMERYYIENNIYKKCYETCKNCEEIGDIYENNCTECYPDYTREDNNCYIDCEYFMYMDINKIFHCTTNETCPPEFPYLINTEKECVKECPDKKYTKLTKVIVDKMECVEECSGEYIFEIDNKCYNECPNGTYYNYTQDGCIDYIPYGYYLNDSEKRTIDICDIKCGNECILDEETDNVLCKSCNNQKYYYRKEEDEEKNGYYDCYNGQIETYFIEDNQYKKCYNICKYCNGLGDILDHNCTACYPGYTLNDTNCYEICNYSYYFDLNNIYHCTETEECPQEFPNKIVEKNICVEKCPEEKYTKWIVDKLECVEECKDEYRFDFDNICYSECPNGTFYNYNQDGCVDYIPIGYYLNNSVNRTIDKCDIKCENECILDEETNNVLCKSCNNKKHYYRKEDDEEKNGYYDCYDGPIETYFIEDNTYKKCYKTCKYCSELGDILNHKCTDCSIEYTLNGTNCYERCNYSYYFDLNNIFHCTENEECPPEVSFHIKEKRICVQNCSNDETFKYNYNNTCYKACPNNTKVYKKVPHTCEDLLQCPFYLNYEQMECIDAIPDGFYLNDSSAKTIDKCIHKCEKCDTSSVNLDLCITCNNIDNFFIKIDDETNNGSYINCYNSSMEGYYFDEYDKRYNRCFEKCKNCFDKGIITSHNCTECKEGFTLNGTNCYEICPYYSYFDSEGIYHCTETEKCPLKYQFIPNKKHCIDKCENDDIYTYVHKGICLDGPYIPNCNESSMFIFNSTRNCTDECDIYDFFDNICILRENNPHHLDYLLSMLTESIEIGLFDELISGMLNGELEGYIIKDKNVTYHLTLIMEDILFENPIPNVSSLNLGECENRLKNHYNIDKDLPLIILKIDYFLNYSLIPVILYELFDPTTKKKLNLTICDNISINLNVPTYEINESTIYKYDPKSIYYSDECDGASEIDYDIILNDRKKEYINNHLSICENNCVFIEYDNDNQKSFCVCDIKKELISFVDLNNKTDLFFTEFQMSESSSKNSMKCFNTLFSKDGISNNIAFYIYTISLLIVLICCFLFYRIGNKSLTKHINRILEIKEKKTEEEILKIGKIARLSKKYKLKELENMMRLKTPKNFKFDFNEIIAKYNINSHDNYSNDQKSLNKLNIYNIKINEVDEQSNNTNVLETEETNHSDYELNFLNFNDAIGVDLRNFQQIYLSLIMYNHPILFILNKEKHYNSIFIKISLVIIAFSFHYFINGLFITKTMIHKVYLTRKSNNTGMFMPYIFSSFAICYILERLLRFAILSDKKIMNISREEVFNDAKIKASKVKKILFIKFICFFSLGILSLLLFGYYLATFGAVYRNTQVFLIRNVMISYIFSLTFPCIIVIIPSLLRRYALKDSTREWIYNLSQVLQY